MKRSFGTLVVCACLGIPTAGCATFNAIAGFTAGETQQESVAMDTLFPSLTPSQRASIDPFGTTPVLWERIGIAQVDDFNRSAAELYGSVLVLQRVVDEGTAWRSDPTYSVAGYNDLRQLAGAGQGVATTAPDRATALSATGQSIVSNIASIASSQPMLIPKATTEVGEGINRVNQSQSMLRQLVPQLSGLVTGN